MASADHATPRGRLRRLLEEDPTDLYENAPMGYLSALPDGRIVKVNRTFGAWTGRRPEELLASRFQDLLTRGGQVFAETHLWPLLRLQGAVREIALDVVRADGSALPCLLNADEVRDEQGMPVLVRLTLFDATARRRYERQLLAAQRAAEESEARSRTLQQVVSDLAATTSVGDVAEVIVERSRAALRALGSALVLIDAEGPAAPAWRVVRSVGLPEDLLRQLQEGASGGPVLGTEPGPRMLRLEEQLWSTRPAVAAAMADAGVSAVVTVPVSADNRLLGELVLGLGAVPGELISLEEPGTLRKTTPAEVDLLQTLGRQAGQALERARLHEETTHQARRAGFLLEAARLLAEAVDVAQTVDLLIELVVARLADVCIIDLASEQGLRRWGVGHRDPARRHLADELRERHLAQQGLAHPTVLALNQGRTQWVHSVDDVLLRRIAVDEQHLEVLRALELADMVSVPLIADGRRLGALTMGADRRRGPFTAADVDVAEQLALQVALVVAKAQRYEVDLRTSHTLQANLLPPPPTAVAGLSVALRYLPATQGVEIGGDFYDVIRLPGDQVAVAVGDVVGHDITAAATMGQLTSVYRALLVDGPSPSAMIDRLQASWSLLGLKRMATALFATLDPASGQLRMASAGHLPPLLLAGGRAEYLPVRPSRMLGAPPAPAPALEWAGVLPVGATLLLFTDGLVESRSADLDAGLSTLLEAVAEAGTSDPDELCDRLLGSLAGEHRADDIALLALTRLS